MFDYFDQELDCNAHDRGFDDACEGVAIDECPFDPWKPGREDWLAGYTAAQELEMALPPAPELDDLLLEAV